MADNTGIINLYTDLAQNPNKDFGWDKGLDNAKAHGYKKEWIDATPSEVWEFCAAVGNPFTHADIKEGDTVLDLGCGAGVDVLVSRLLVGESGKVYGVDITPKMVEVASTHAKNAGFSNVAIIESSFDSITLEDESVDVIISNGAINLTSCKESVFAEIYRLLKPNAKIFFADMIDISEPSCCSIEQSSCCNTSEPQEDWANCVAGTMRESELIELIQKAGFKDVECTGHTHYTTADTTKGATFKATKVASSELREKHWDAIFQTTDYTQVLWHEETPLKSLELIMQYSKKDNSLIDIGCGASLLVDNLLKNDYKDITLVDTSKTSLEIVKKRVKNENITYVCGDILNFTTQKSFALWHDRAVFHFLLSKKERELYFKVLTDSLKYDGVAVISSFRVNGPMACAGLDIVQYNREKILQELPKNLRLIESEEFTHITPKGTTQEYIYFVLKKCE
ncbi:tRNA (adenine57/58-N1)-methyltransferase [hydrothermal vent metagenome]|uniref:tRNA (Adenine57/58-N1)-methyltransferase n=1 Tax=hydrothermal vent metagenome TaxID=652676 RepID=A0A1W1CBL8_9ZZZZ